VLTNIILSKFLGFAYEDSILRGFSVPDRIGTLIALERLGYCMIRNWEVKIMAIVMVLSVYKGEKYEDSIHD
jgi:hypothetical protein